MSKPTKPKPSVWRRMSVSARARWYMSTGMTLLETTKKLGCSRQLVDQARKHKDERGRPKPEE